MTLWQDAFKILIWLQILKIYIILLRGNFNNFRPKNGWKCHKTYNRPLPWQQMSKRSNVFILFMCTQRTFTSQVTSKIYFLTFASYIEKLPEITLNTSEPQNSRFSKHMPQLKFSLKMFQILKFHPVFGLRNKEMTFLK